MKLQFRLNTNCMLAFFFERSIGRISQANNNFGAIVNRLTTVVILLTMLAKNQNLNH